MDYDLPLSLATIGEAVERQAASMSQPTARLFARRIETKLPFIRSAYRLSCQSERLIAGLLSQ